MDPEPLEDEKVEKYPNLDVVFYIHHLRTTDDEVVATKLLEVIERDAMMPLFESISEAFVWCTYDESTLNHMQLINFAELSILDKAISDARASFNNYELGLCLMKKAKYCSKIGDTGTAMMCLEEACQLMLPFTPLCDTLFHMVRIGMWNLHYKTMQMFLKAANNLYIVASHKFSWERTSRLKLYEGVYRICVRDFKCACEFFITEIATYRANEVMSYARFIRYTVYLAMVQLTRTELKKKIIDDHRVQEILSEDQETKGYLHSLYHCNYNEFFSYLAIIEQNMRRDHFFHMHYQYYVREMKIVAYKQLLHSFKSLSLSYIADEFGVTEEFIEREFFYLISTGRLYCQIDRLNGMVEMSKVDEPNIQFKMIIKSGDLLLNKIEKLRRRLVF